MTWGGSRVHEVSAGALSDGPSESAGSCSSTSLRLTDQKAHDGVFSNSKWMRNRTPNRKFWDRDETTGSCPGLG